MGLEAGLGEALRTMAGRVEPTLAAFEGTATIQNLIVGRDITGVSAFTAGV